VVHHFGILDIREERIARTGFILGLFIRCFEIRNTMGPILTRQPMAAVSATLTTVPTWESQTLQSSDLGLSTARRAIEGRFLEAGDVLAAAVQGIGALIGALGHLSESLTPEALIATTGDLSTAATELLSLSDAHDARRLRIANLSEANAAVGACMAEMQPNLAYLRICAVNIKITSGGIGAAGPAFSNFGQEIVDRIALGSEQLEAFGKELASLDVTLRSARKVEEELGRCCENILPAVPNALLASSETLSAHHARIAGIAYEVSTAAKDIQKKVGRTLSALQIGDITRQRIEHVEQGLDDLETAPTLVDLPHDQRERLSNAVRWLLQAQLRAAATDFHAEAASVCETMRAIASDAEAILRLKDVVADGHNSGSHNVLEGLADEIDKALLVVARTDEGVQGAEAVNRTAVEAARALSGRITEIQSVRADVKMMALNGSFRGARIGDSGRALNAIAMERRQHADQLATSVGLTTSALETLAAQADLHAPETDADTPPLATATSLSQAVNRIRDASASLNQQLQSVAAQGKAVVQELDTALGRIDFQTDLGGGLDRAVDRLVQSAGAPDGDYDERERGLLEPILTRLAASYTMAQEREVHQHARDQLGLGEPDGQKPPAAPAAIDPFDDGLF